MRALVTGGAGFIGSHLADALLAQGEDVRIIDDLSTGRGANLPPSARFIEGSITDPAMLETAVSGAEVVFHQAALGSVARSVNDPLVTDEVNTHGTLAVLAAAHRLGVRRVVLASSSSVYGGAESRPTPESTPLVPRSPYAVTKMASEHYARVYAELFGLETVALRYFNVYGPRQRPDSTYAAVIPLFIAALRSGTPPEVHGDGRQSRDFAYVDDVVAPTSRRPPPRPRTVQERRTTSPAGGSDRCWRCSTSSGAPSAPTSWPSTSPLAPATCATALPTSRRPPTTWGTTPGSASRRAWPARSHTSPDRDANDGVSGQDRP